MQLEARAEHIHDELIRQCLQGDNNSYQRLYKLYSRSMYNVGYRIVNNADEAEDVLQEAFISAFKNLHHYRGDSTFGAWLKRIVVNKALNQISKRKFERIPENEQWDIAEETEKDELENFPFTVDKVKRAIELLPDGYRMVLSLYVMEGYDHQEIAEILNITESTSKSQFNRSKKKLKEILTNSRFKIE